MKKTSLDKTETEKKLLPRLRYMGFLLLFFSLFTFSYALIVSPYLATPAEETTLVKEEEMGLPITDSELTLPNGKHLNLFLVAGIFGTVGLSCLLIFWK